MDKNILTYNSFDVYKNLKSFTTCRDFVGGNDKIRYTGINSDSKFNRQSLASYAGIKQPQLVFPVQTHTSNVIVVNDTHPKDLENVDALVTNIPNLCLCIQTADCVPVLLYDPVKNVVAAVHSGWRGTVNHIVEYAIVKMVEVYGCVANSILAVIGPSIGPDHYQVGEEVANAVYKNVPHPELSIIVDNDNTIFFNLWEANKQILINCGLLETKIEISGLCTFKHKNLFYSARREGIGTGRMASGIMLIDE